MEVLNLCLLSGERIDQLYADDIQIIQNKEVFLFPLMQSYWLIFRNYQKGKIVDLLCAGNGAVGLFVGRKTAARSTKSNYNLVWQIWVNSILLNKLEKQVTMYERDLKQATEVIKRFCGFSTM